MTREEVIESLKGQIKCLKCETGIDCEKCRPNWLIENDIKALDMTIKTLEQEPCEDMISRQAVLEQTYNWSKDEFLRVTNPFDYLRKRINSLPSVNLDQKIGIGHQIKHELKDEDFNKDFIFYECSCCGDVLKFRCNYCPNCGTKFEGEIE